MFTANLIESTKDEIELYDVDGEALREILSYLYTSNVDITDNNVQSIFTSASLFEILDLRDLCSKYMSQELCLANCVSVYQFASFHDCSALKNTSRAFVVNHFSEVVDYDDILSLSSDDLAELISEDNLNIRREETVFECVMKWVETNIDERMKQIGTLFKHIRFVLIDEEYITDKVTSNELVMSNSFCKSILVMVRLYKTAKEDAEDGVTDTFGLPANPRLGMFYRKMMVFVGGSQERNNRAFTCFDPLSGKNYYAVPLHVSFDFKYRIDHHRAVVSDRNDVYIIGGIFYEVHHFDESGSALSEVRMFDSYHKTWMECASMETPRCAHAVVNCKGLLYAIGGKASYPGGTPLSLVECYDPEKDHWRNVEPMPVRLCHHQAVVRRNKILVIGGFSEGDVATRVFLEYDPELDVWKTLEPTMRIVRAEFGAVVINDSLYVIGGNDGENKLSSVEIFDFNTNKWQFGEDFPEDRKSMVTVAFDGYILLCGGVRTLISRVNRAPRIVETKDLWKLDPKVGLWSREAKFVQFANVHACVITEVNTKRLHESEFVSHRPL